MQLLQRVPLSRPRRYLAALGVTGIAVASVVGIAAQPAAAASFPVPSPINVTNITFNKFDLQVGKVGAVRTFEYRLNGGQQVAGGLGGIVGTYKASIGVLKQNTDYSLIVREIDIHTGVGGPFSAPRLIHTPAYVAPPKPTTPGSFRTTAVTSTAVTLAWSPSTDPTFAASTLKYRYFLDGKLAGTGGPTGATIAVSPGTTYAVQVDALNPNGVRSDRASLTVTTPGIAPVVSRPTAPANLRVTSTTAGTVGLNWDQSTDPLFASTDLAYRVYVDGVPNGQFGGLQGCVYCDPGFTGGAATGLNPQTSYTIGVAAINPNGVESVLATIVVTTTP
jgi:chitodextrinase